MTALAGYALIACAIMGTATFALGWARRLGGVRLAPTAFVVVAGAGCWLATEGASLVRAVGPAGSAVCALLATALGLTPIGRGARWRDALRALRQRLTPIAAAAPVLAAILALTALVALASPPNTWDAMTYHNPRVLHWLAQGSVEHYETSIDRQLRMPPLAAYFRLHAMALTGSDRLFGALQWTFFAACIAQAAALARALSGSDAAALASAAFVATAPLAILESSSAQNDLVVSGFLLAAAVAVAEVARSVPARAVLPLLACAAVGLGAATKETAWTIGPLILGAGVLWAWSRPRQRTAWLAGVALALVLVAPHAMRNRHRFGGLVPHPVVVALSSWSDHGPARVVSQLWRGALLQVQPLFRREATARPLVAADAALHQVLGLPPADPAITWTADVAFLRRTSPLHEDTAGSPVHFALAAVASVAALAVPRLRRERRIVQWFALAWLAWAAVVVPVRWMPWGARLQLPALLLFAAPFGAVCTAVGSASGARRRAVVVACVLGLLALPWLFLNATRPLLSRAGAPSIFRLSRWENLFRNQPELRSEVERVIDRLPPDCSTIRPVGLRIGGHQWEYALWAGAAHAGRRLSFVHLAAGPPPAGICAAVTDACAGETLCTGPP